MTTPSRHVSHCWGWVRQKFYTPNWASKAWDWDGTILIFQPDWNHRISWVAPWWWRKFRCVLMPKFPVDVDYIRTYIIMDYYLLLCAEFESCIQETKQLSALNFWSQSLFCRAKAPSHWCHRWMFFERVAIQFFVSFLVRCEMIDFHKKHMS